MQNALQFYLFLIPAFLFSQSSFLQKPVQHAPAPDSSEWSGQLDFMGTLDDAAMVQVQLFIENEKVEGKLIYPKTNETFRLEGKHENGKLALNEWDSEGRLTGKVQAAFDSLGLKGEWFNHDGSIGVLLDLEKNKKPNPQPLNCAQNKWINRYTAYYRNEPLLLVVQKTNRTSMSGSLWIAVESNHYKILGDWVSENNFEGHLTQSEKTVGMIKGTVKDKGKLSIHVDFAKSQAYDFEFSLAESMSIACRNHADYSSLFDLIVPKPKCQSGNAFFEKQADRWMNACRQKANPKRVAPQPKTRAALRASAWSELSLWDGRLLSGLLYFSSTWEEGVEVVPFTFDLGRDEALSLDAIFIKKFDADQWLQHYAKDKQTSLPYWEDEPYKVWITGYGFPHRTLRQDGLQLTSPFHEIYGTAQILVPWADLMPYLKKSAVKTLVTAR